MHRPILPSFAAVAFAVVALIVAACAGCRTVAYTDTSGRRLEVTTLLMDSKFGSAEVHTPEGGLLRIENYDSTAQLARTIEALAKPKP